MNESIAPKKLYHDPVLLTESIDELAHAPAGGWIVDCTYGDGGHSKEIFHQLIKPFSNNRLVSIDWDLSGFNARKTHAEVMPDTVEEASNKSAWVIVEDNFAHIDAVLAVANKKTGYGETISGVLLDLGISSRQYVQKSRGFSFSAHGKADMRMNPLLYSVAAYDLLNNLPYKQLRNMFMKFTGMPEFLAVKLAKELILARDIKKFGNMDDIDRLNEISYKVQPTRKNSVGRIHPSTLLFLALRIAVNTELQNLQEVLPKALKLSKKGAKLLVMTYHSGEEEIVHEFARENGYDLRYIAPSPKEIRTNPRARSAKLYVFTV